MDIQLKQQLEAYSEGRLSRSELQESTSLNFFEVLESLAVYSLKLPKVDTTERYNDTQKELYNSFFTNQREER